MRLQRLFVISFAFYLTFIGGSAYYNLIPPLRAFHHAVVTVVLAGWLLWALRRGGLPTTPLNLPILAGLLAWFVSALLSLDPRAALENVWLPVTHAVMFFVIVDLLQRGRQKWIMEAAFILGTLVVLITALEVASWYFGLGIIPGTQVGWAQFGLIPPTLPRADLALNVGTRVGAFVAPLVTLTAAWALTVRRPSQRAVLWVLAASLLIVLLLSASRGGWLSLAAAAGLLILLRVLTHPRLAGRRRVALGGALIAAGGIAVVAGLAVLSVSDDRQSGDDVRVDLWRSAIAITGDYPVLGVGPGLFGRAWRSYRDPQYGRDHLATTHNAPLNTASENGLVGVAVSLWLGGALLAAWLARWREAESAARRLRLEAAACALVGFGVHSLVDVFVSTPVVLLTLLLAAYMVTGHKTVLDVPAKPGALERGLAALFTVVVLAYGAWFALRVDPAHLAAYNALRAPDIDTALALTEEARALDPALRLYDLQYTYIKGIQADRSGDPDTLAEAVAAYERALTLEPTWDGGLVNLAALRVAQGDSEVALELLDAARRINPLTTPATLGWARLAEVTERADRQEIALAYLDALDGELRAGRLPLHPFWWESPIREAALNEFVAGIPPRDLRYMIYRAYQPAIAEMLVPSSPLSYSDWWVYGEHLLTVEGDASSAAHAFRRALQLAQATAPRARWGDYHAAYGRALMQFDPSIAPHQFDLARLWGVQYETLPDDPSRTPSNDINPGLTSVLYSGRAQSFELLPEFRVPYGTESSQ